MNEVKQAIKERWPVNSFHRSRALELIEETLNDEKNPLRIKMQALKVMVQMDSLNLKEEYIRQMNQPKRIHVTHSKLSDEELMKMVEEKAKEIGLSLSEFPIEALPHLKERMLEGSIK